MSWLYKNTVDNSSRFILGIVGETPLVCFGINPSTATPENLDRTLESVNRISLNNGYDSWIMLNVYPQRATDPNDIHKELDVKLHELNLIEIENILQRYQPTIWAAWGTLIEKRSFLTECLADIVDIGRKYNCRWVFFGKVSKDGHPHHPLYLGKFETPKEFFIDEYIEKLR